MKKRLFAAILVFLLLLPVIPAASAAATITFRLVGADRDGNYVTWIPTTEYPVTKLSKVGSILKQAAEEHGLTLTGLETDYISAITAPDALGGYTMAEFTNGPNSGWMYTINGPHPGRSVNNFYLKSGDELVFHYVNDYMYEVEDWSGGQSLGTEEDWNHWLDAEDVLPSEPEKEPEEEPEREPEQEPEQEENADVSDLIEAIDECSVTKANQKTRLKLEALEEAYDALSKDQRRQVTNADDLQLLREEFDELLEEAVEEAQDEWEEFYDDLELPKDQKDEAEEIYEEVSDDLEEAEDTDELDDFLSEGKKELRKLTGQQEEVPAITMSFSDVAKADWFYEDVVFAVGQGLFNGVSAAEFAPHASMTRAMLVSVLYRMAGSPTAGGTASFADVPAGQWYTDAVAWANEAGIVSGYSDTVFGTDDHVTREQIAVILYRYAAWSGEDVTPYSDLTSYEDFSSIGAYAVSAMSWAKAEGLIGGRTETTLAPKGTATRAEVAAILHRFAENF